MKQALYGKSRWSSWSCRFRSFPAFETLSHSASRTFHIKSRPIPPTALEKFRASTTTTNPSSSAFFVHITHSASSSSRRSRYRFFSSSPLHTMADQVHWTGPRVRQTFLDYFAERGHTVGMLPRHPSFVPNSQVRPLQLCTSRLRDWLHGCLECHVSITSAILTKFPLRSALFVGCPSQ